MGPPETTIWEYPGEDASWRDEFAHFVDCIETRRRPLGTLDDALAALDVVGRVYGRSGQSILAFSAPWGREAGGEGWRCQPLIPYPSPPRREERAEGRLAG